MPLRHRSHSFNLVEILISLAVLVVSLFILMSAVPAALKNLDKTKSNIYAPMAAQATAAWLQMYLNDALPYGAGSTDGGQTIAAKTSSRFEIQPGFGGSYYIGCSTSFGYWCSTPGAMYATWAPVAPDATPPYTVDLPSNSYFNVLPTAAPATTGSVSPWTSDPYYEGAADFVAVYSPAEGHSLWQSQSHPELLRYRASSRIQVPDSASPGSLKPASVVDFECGLRIWVEAEANSQMTALRAHGADNYVCDYWTGVNDLYFKSGSNQQAQGIDYWKSAGPVWRTPRARIVHVLVTWPITEPFSQRLARGNYFHVTRLVKGNTAAELIDWTIFNRW